MTAAAQRSKSFLQEAEIVSFETAANRIARARGGVTSFATIMRRISKVTGISKEQIVGPSRCREIVFARHAVLYWARRLTTLSHMDIGKRVGRPAHKTVHHAVESYPIKRKRMGRNLRKLQRVAGHPSIKKLGL